LGEAAAMTTALTKYDAACRAIAEAATVDEVKGFHDEAKAMAAYARQAKNRELEAQCVEIRMRATRRLGEMIAEQKRTVGLNRGNAGGFSNNPPDERPTLESQGIGKNLAQQARTLSLLPEARFEERVAEAREVALGGVVDKAVKRRRRQAFEDDFDKPYGKPAEHGNAPYEHRQEARKQRSKAAAISRMAPNTVEGWRRGYLTACRSSTCSTPAPRTATSPAPMRNL